MSNIFIDGIEEKYPEVLLSKRVNCEANVIGCLAKDMLLYDDGNLNVDTFITRDGRFLFCLIKLLREKKVSVFDEVSILTYTSQEMKDRLDDIGGYIKIANMVECVNSKNYESYLDELLKSNIILKMHDFGFNLLDPIDCDGKKIKPIKLFDKFTSDQVSEWYEAKLATFGTGYSSKILDNQWLDIDDSFIESLRAGENSGCPIDIMGTDVDGVPIKSLPYFSKQINGIPTDGMTLIGGYSNVGKTTLVLQILMSMMYYGRKCIVISNEQRIRNFQLGFLSLILTLYLGYYNVTKTKLLNGTWSDDDDVYIKKAQQYWREHFYGKIRFAAIPDANIDISVKEFKKAILNDGINTCVYDTFKLDLSGNSSQDAYWASLIQDSRKLNTIAKKYNIMMICTAQLAISTIGKLFLDSSVLSMSKQIKEVCDLMILMRNVFPEEFEPQGRYYCNPYKTIQKNDEWVDQEWTPAQNEIYRAVFIEKSRQSGNLSSDTGIAYIFHFQGQWGIWHDSAKAKIRHGTIT